MTIGIRSFNKINVLTLMGFGSHLGSLDLREWNSESSSYIHSRIKSRFMINLGFTSFAISKSVKFLNFCSMKKLRTLFFFKDGFTNYLYKIPRADWFWSGNFFLVNKWVPGSLTNYKSVRPKILRFRNFTNLTEYPNVLVYLDSIRFLDLAATESRIMKLPSIGFTDTDSGFAPFSYSIPGNNKSFATLFAYYMLYFNSILMGSISSSFVYWDSARSIVSKHLKFFKLVGTKFINLRSKNNIFNISRRRKRVWFKKTSFFKPLYKRIFNRSRFFLPQIFFYGGKLGRRFRYSKFNNKYKHNKFNNKYKHNKFNNKYKHNKFNNKYK